MLSCSWPWRGYLTLHHLRHVKFAAETCMHAVHARHMLSGWNSTLAKLHSAVILRCLLQEEGSGQACEGERVRGHQALQPGEPQHPLSASRTPLHCQLKEFSSPLDQV